MEIQTSRQKSSGLHSPRDPVILACDFGPPPRVWWSIESPWFLSRRVTGLHAVGRTGEPPLVTWRRGGRTFALAIGVFQVTQLANSNCTYYMGYVRDKC